MNEKRDAKGRFIKGVHYHPETEFKKGTHWRTEKCYWEKEWLRHEYEDNFRSALDIAEQFGVTEAAILHWLRKHNIPRRNMSTIRTEKYWGLIGKQNGMYGKIGDKNPNYKGGVTPERQDFYNSREWKIACLQVYKRDNAKCVRCGNDNDLHVHHIVPFANKKLRANPDNLVLLCADCHHWVHSKNNKKGEFIG